MTRVNILLPFFQTTIQTNNSQVITEILNDKYGLTPSEIFWLDSQRDGYECVVRIQNFALTFDGAIQEMESRLAAEETLRRMQVDIFNVIKKYEDLFQERKNMIPLDRLRDEMANEVEDSEVSLKIQEKPRPPKELMIGYSQHQLKGAIWDLTHENLKLKDAIIFYEAQLELIKGSDIQPSMRKPK